MADDIEPNGPPPEEAGNRTFLIAAASLGGLFLIGLIFIGVYTLFIRPGVIAGQQAQAATIEAQNTAVAQAITQTALAGQVSPTSPVTLTPIPPSPSPVVRPTDTPTIEPSPTTEPGTLEALTGTPAELGAVTDTPTPRPGGPSLTPTQTAEVRTATAIAAITSTARSQAGAASPTPRPSPTRTPGQMPQTGFADEAGIPTMLMASLVLVAVLVIARRLRLSNMN